MINSQINFIEQVKKKNKQLLIKKKKSCQSEHEDPGKYTPIKTKTF